jgi:hypothetical protein
VRKLQRDLDESALRDDITEDHAGLMGKRQAAQQERKRHANRCTQLPATAHRQA